MTYPQNKPDRESVSKPRPGLWEQAVITLKILLGAGVVLGGIWLLDTLSINQ
jgi:hypothetical protein